MMRDGFTLIELLISLAIGLLLVTLSFTGFQQARKTMDRTENRLAMHQRAAAVTRAMRSDLALAMPQCAMFVRSVVDDPGTPTTDETALELVFMRGKIDVDNWTMSQAVTDYNSDMLWVQWRWDRATGFISAGVNQNYRSFNNQISWQPSSGPTSDDFKGYNFFTTPQPRRVLDPFLPWQTLDDNVWRVDSTKRDQNDLGDGSELSAQTRPAIRQATACWLELVMSDGSSQRYDGSVARTDVFNGIPVDGTISKLPTGDSVANRFLASEIAHRPRLLRMHFTLTDARIDLHQDFAFSAALPGVLPGPPP